MAAPYHRNGVRGSLYFEKRTPCPGGRRGCMIESLPGGEGGRGSARGRMRRDCTAITRVRAAAARFALISPLRGQLPPMGKPEQHRLIPALKLKHRSAAPRHGICVAKMLDNTQSIICAFGLAAAAPRSPYRHLELCGIALMKKRPLRSASLFLLIHSLIILPVLLGRKTRGIFKDAAEMRRRHKAGLFRNVRDALV